MTCAQLEILLCDYLDGTLEPGERIEIERHLSECVACAELARDAGAAVRFLERVADVEPPPQLLTRILQATEAEREKLPSWMAAGGRARGWLARFLAPVLEPRLVMGMALTVLSFSMMAKCAGIPSRPLKAADLQPAVVWSGVEDRAHRTWDRTVKFYESLRFVYEVQSRLRQLTEQQEEEDRQAAAQRPVGERKLPAGGTVEAGKAPAGEENAAH